MSNEPNASRRLSTAPAASSSSPGGPPWLRRGRPAFVSAGPLRGRERFAALRAQGRRARSGPVTVTFVPRAGPEGPPAAAPAAGPAAQHGHAEACVAFAVGRTVGGAVVRNRLRRRLRSIVAGAELPCGDYLITVGPEATTVPYGRLRACTEDAVRAATAAPPAPRRAARRGSR